MCPVKVPGLFFHSESLLNTSNLPTSIIWLPSSSAFRQKGCRMPKMVYCDLLYFSSCEYTIATIISYNCCVRPFYISASLKPYRSSDGALCVEGRRRQRIYKGRFFCPGSSYIIPVKLLKFGFLCFNNQITKKSMFFVTLLSPQIRNVI